MNVVIDTNVFVSAIMNPANAPRQVLRLCLRGELTPLMGNALFVEYEDVLARDALFDDTILDSRGRGELLDAFMSVCRWVSVYYLWRPNMTDEADNHLIELAVAGNASHIITRNLRDLRSQELLFPRIAVMTAGTFLTEWSK